MKEINAVVAGAGLWGCTLARRLAEAGRKVLVLEKRADVGGNARCAIDPETGIEVHLYGCHIFHTHIPAVWDFIRRFTDFNGYQHKGIARYKGKSFFLPLGLSLINKFFDKELTPAEAKTFMEDPSHARAVFDAFFRGYTSKQWGKSPEEIDPSIIKRIPVRYNYELNYYNDYNQGIPLHGYEPFFEHLLNHPNISVECNAVFSLEGLRLQSGRFGLMNDIPVYYSGPIDELFSYRFGALPWRTLRFETEKLDVADYQGSSVVNFTEVEIPYTRIHEFKHFHPEQKDVMAFPKTVITREYPGQWKMGDEPYYPINNAESAALLAKYQNEAKRLCPQVLIGGRLGSYRYYDMDKTIEAALSVSLD